MAFVLAALGYVIAYNVLRWLSGARFSRFTVVCATLVLSPALLFGSVVLAEKVSGQGSGLAGLGALTLGLVLAVLATLALAFVGLARLAKATKGRRREVAAGSMAGAAPGSVRVRGSSLAAFSAAFGLLLAYYIWPTGASLASLPSVSISMLFRILAAIGTMLGFAWVGLVLWRNHS